MYWKQFYLLNHDVMPSSWNYSTPGKLKSTQEGAFKFSERENEDSASVKFLTKFASARARGFCLSVQAPQTKTSLRLSNPYGKQSSLLPCHFL